MANPLAVGILGLLSGLGQGLEIEREKKRKKAERESDIARETKDKETERADRLAERQATEQYRKETLALQDRQIKETERANKAREAGDLNEEEWKDTIRDINAQTAHRLNLLDLENRTLRAAVTEAGKKKEKEDLTPEEEESSYLLKLMSEVVKDEPGILNDPNKFGQKMRVLRDQYRLTKGTFKLPEPSAFPGPQIPEDQRSLYPGAYEQRGPGFFDMIRYLTGGGQNVTSVPESEMPGAQVNFENPIDINEILLNQLGGQLAPGPVPLGGLQRNKPIKTIK